MGFFFNSNERLAYSAKKKFDKVFQEFLDDSDEENACDCCCNEDSNLEDEDYTKMLRMMQLAEVMEDTINKHKNLAEKNSKEKKKPMKEPGKMSKQQKREDKNRRQVEPRKDLTQNNAIKEVPTNCGTSTVK